MSSDDRTLPAGWVRRYDAAYVNQLFYPNKFFWVHPLDHASYVGSSKNPELSTDAPRRVDTQKAYNVSRPNYSRMRATSVGSYDDYTVDGSSGSSDWAESP
ncbi:hypothetical protein SISNIDRAFT_497544 [Sistotremastrum niveocremeum HHB9708]|uniref:WW domain-containing protein n=1 Tax=Sistotremastrum niveocremeum HHB9708 TaxID=1314777 RepID=A0A164Q5V7_9AGAM|nr:hypothetical protein SISNIDRAFT_497544 [Sistotremastrum niveocremeum HHB9708]